MTGSCADAADDAPASISIVMPVLDEAPVLADSIARLGGAVQIVVADGGSRDASAAIARESGVLVVDAPRGRALQMNAGAARATGDILLFLHADARLPADWADRVRSAIGGRPLAWGRFDVRLDDESPSLRVVGAMMNLRSRLTGICTGDQAIFVTRAAWRTMGGYAPIALMEDIELSSRLRRTVGPPTPIAAPVRVSARRWRARGVWRTIVTMWWLRLLYWFGVSPAALQARYDGQGGGRPVR